ncbi:hypothetical protein H8E88_11580 [candidate division KSB1 bacterium]|nr:hypothetical protein [candidate division KSB1 bacterium]
MALKLEKSLQNKSPKIYIKNILKNIRETSKLEIPQLFLHFYHTLKLLPIKQGRSLVRCAFLTYLFKIAKDYPNDVVKLLKEFQTFLINYRHLPNILDPYFRIIRSWDPTKMYNHSFYCFWEEMLDEIEDQKLLSKVFQTVGDICQEHEIDFNDNNNELIVMLVKVIKEVSNAKRCFIELVNTGLHNNYYSHEVLKCAYILDEKNGWFPELVKILDKAEEKDSAICNKIMLFDKQLKKAGWHELSRHLVLNGRMSQLQTISPYLNFFQAIKVQIDAPAYSSSQKNPCWLNQYPKEFVNELNILSQIAPDAKKATAKILDKDIPNSDNLEKEINRTETLLSKKPNGVNLTKRLQNLRKYQSSIDKVSPARLENLKKKLNQKIERLLITIWQKSLKLEFEKEIINQLGISEAPEWLFKDRQIQVLSSMFQLTPSFRKLGLRLFKLRCGPPPWNLLHAPANQAFLNKLRLRGINPEPWLNPPNQQAKTGKNGQVVTLSFENDPLEIFQMGNYFQTCLSAGNWNFFSVFANAADINKHVIYARENKNRVIGRCLIALSEEGGILTFYPYCYDNELGFSEMIEKLANELAERMKTIVLKKGFVQTLAATDWYDDCPWDINNRFSFLQKNSRFRNSLINMSKKEFIPALEREFHPLPLNSLTLPLILELPGLDKNPQLIIPLFPYLEGCNNLSDSAWFRVAKLASRCNMFSFPYRILQKKVIPYFLNDFLVYNPLDKDILKLLIEVNPSAGLRLLRQTRIKDIQSDIDEVDEDRRELLALAFEKLGRTKQALQLREGK